MNIFFRRRSRIWLLVVLTWALGVVGSQLGEKALSLPFVKRAAQAQAEVKAKEAAPQIREKWAVLVGLSHFQDGGIIAEPYSERAVMVLRSAMFDPESGRFPHDHVVTLTQDQATKEAIVDALSESWLMKKALPNDLIVIYFCSKALPDKAGNGLLLCAYDTRLDQADESGVPLQAVLADLRRRTQCKNIICLLDLSPVIGDMSPPTNTLYPLANSNGRGANLSPLARLSLLSNVSFLSANEILKPSYQSDQRKNSYFAYYLADFLRQPDGLRPLGELSQFVADNVLRDVYHELHKQQIVELALAPESANLAALALGVATGKPAPPRPWRIGYQYDRLAMDRPDLMPGATPDPAPLATKPNKTSASAQDENDDEPAQEVDMHPYLQHMKTAVQAKWQPPKGLEQKKVVVIFTILKDGTITDPEITEPSGEPSVDQSALQALKSASPLPPLPMGAPKTIQVRYKFEWKVSTHSG